MRIGSTNYDNWIKTPIPMYLEVYFFNWTNPEEISNYTNVKPNFEERGPYVFREIHERKNLIWNDNHTVTFNQRRTWYYEPGLSNGSLDDEITNLNVMSLSAASFEKDANFLIKEGLEIMLRLQGSFTWTKTVRELVFDGVKDPLLDVLNSINSTMGIKIPFDKFGWFYGRNLSDTYDGSFTMNTGNDSLTKLGYLTQWNGSNSTNMYRGRCGRVKGTTGELWPPEIGNRSEIELFAGDVCRSINLKYSEKMTMYDVVGSKYVGDESVFDNGTEYVEAKCWCNADKCPDLPSGVFNASACKFNSPTFVSFPHFYLADESYLKMMTGLKPNKTKHEFSIALEPTTGIPLNVEAKLQINMLMQPIKHFKYYENVPKMMVPMIWFIQRAALTPDLAEQAKVILLWRVIQGIKFRWKVLSHLWDSYSSYLD